MKQGFYFSVVLMFVGGPFCACETLSQELDARSPEHVYSLIAPAKSIQSGLLLEPPLDLDWFTREKFLEIMASVGKEKIHKKWTSPVVPLPDHPRPNTQGLTSDEVKAYMQTAKRLFHEGGAIPVSDVGLISTQEDVVRQPMLNHIAGFANETVRVYLLVQRTIDSDWGYFSIVQDLNVNPPIDYYGQILDADVKFEGTSCYKCHSSGPLAIHPAREDLVLDAALAAALSGYIAEQPRSAFFFPEHSPKPRTGKPMALSACTTCHAEDGDRSPLYQVHSHPIRILVDFGYMPPGERLSADEIAEIKTWLNDKDLRFTDQP
ncbi:MAG: cytochrome c [Aureliella sp.]